MNREQISVGVDREDLPALDSQARTARRTRASMVRVFIAEGLERRGWRKVGAEWVEPVATLPERVA